MDWVKFILDLVLSAAVLALVPKLFAYLGALANREKHLARTVIDDLALRAVRDAVLAVTTPLAENYRKAASDGKLSDQEKARLHGLAKDTAMRVLKTKGINALKEIGGEALDLFIRLVVEKTKPKEQK